MLPLWSPRLWGAHAVGVLLLLAAVGLGMWQFGAWQAQREAEARDITNAAPVPLADVFGPDDSFPGLAVGQPVTLTGTWVSDGTVYVERDSGYWVVTPVAVGGEGQPAIPVVRGTSTTPSAPARSGEVTLTGWLQPGEGAQGVADDDPSDDVLPLLRIADVIQHVDQDLYGGYVISQEPETGLAAATIEQRPKSGNFTGLRNFLYGVEWWVFGGFAIFMWWRYVQDVRQGTRAVAEQHDDVPSNV